MKRAGTLSYRRQASVKGFLDAGELAGEVKLEGLGVVQLLILERHSDTFYRRRLGSEPLES